MSKSPFLESNTKFRFRNHKASQIYTEDEFFKWSSNHFYRTSSNDMSEKVPILLHQKSCFTFGPNILLDIYEKKVNCDPWLLWLYAPPS